MRRVVAVLWVVSATTSIAFFVLRLLNVYGHERLDFFALVTLSVSTATLGFLILRRHPGHVVGALFLALGATTAVSVALGSIVTELDRASTTAGVVTLVEEAIRIWGLGLAGVTLLYFPTGRLLSKRWRLVVVGFAVTTTLGYLSDQLLMPGPIDANLGVDIMNPIANASTARVAHALKPLGFLATLVFGAVVVSMVLRYRRSSGVEREQFKIFAASVVGVIILIVGATALFNEQVERGWLGSAVWQTPGVLPPVAAAYAILRRGLFDIDRVISRTLSYAIVTAVLAGTFVVVALVPTAIFGTGERPDWVAAVATLAVAALFRPVRRRVQDAVDHRFNRKRYDAEHTVDAFAARLREQIDIDALGAELSNVVVRTMQPAHVSLWMRAP